MKKYVKRINMGNFMKKVSLSQMIPNCLIWREKAKNKFCEKRPFFHSSILYLSKASTMPNLRAVTLYLVEFLSVLVSKSVTSASSLLNKARLA